MQQSIEELHPPPEPIRHVYRLKDKRQLVYNTFATATTHSVHDLDDLHPILFVHGFPGSGLEGTLCAEAAAIHKSEVFAVDRPGFGLSDPLPDEVARNPDSLIQAVVNDMWDFIEGQGWKSFSLVAVSGGGPFALAFLESYLELVGARRPPSKLESVALVACACYSANDDTTSSTIPPHNRQLYAWSTKSTLNSWMGSLSWCQLLLKYVLQRRMLQFLPKKWVMASLEHDSKVLPEIDQSLLQTDVAQTLFWRDGKEAFRQAAKPTAYESRALFRSKQGCEDALKKKWKKLYDKDCTLLPKMTLFHGTLDANVPISHSRYIYETLLSEKGVQLQEYPDMGHVSLMIYKAEDYIQQVLPQSSKK